MSKKTQLLLGTLVVIAIGILIVVFGNQKPLIQEETTKLENVKVQTVSELVASENQLLVYGTVVASDSVDVIPEIPGVVAKVNKRLGDIVKEGDVIVELQNTSQRQTVLQAQAATEVSNAQLSQVKNGADIEDIRNQETDVLNKKTTLDQTVVASKQTANDLFITIVTSIENTFDQYFDDPKRTPQLLFGTNNLSETVELEESRIQLAIRALETEQQVQVAPTTLTGVKQAFDAVSRLISEYTEAIDLMSNITQVQPNSKTSQEQKDERLQQLRAMKQVVVSVESQLASARITLDGALSAYTVAQNNLEKILSGADTEDISIAQSGLSSARAQLAAAQLGLEKTYIKAPTSGRISAMNTTVGQLVGQTPVFTVASSGIKRVDIFLASQDIERIAVGDVALIDEKISGSVTRISPTIDVATGKIKVEVLITDTATLVEGAGVGVVIQSQETNSGFSIPIEAVFVEDEKSYVFVVNEDDMLQKRVIETEGLYGSFVNVVSGLSTADTIVLLARGLKEGQLISPETK